MPGFGGVRLGHIEKRRLEERLGTETVLTADFRGRHRLGLRIVLVPIALAVGWSCAWAQQGPVMPPGATSPAAMTPPPALLPPPADAADPKPEHIAKARRLILATGISRSFQIIIPEFMEQIGNSLTQSRPELVPDMNIVLDQLRPEFDKQSDEMVEQSARIYASLLSEKDIDAILTFFDSEAGKKYVGAQPLFLNQLVSGMQAWQQKISITMMSRVREEMKKKGHDL